jgi:hypothetical protein
MTRRIFGSKEQGTNGKVKKCIMSIFIIGQVNVNVMAWHAARSGKIQTHTTFYSENPKGKGYLGGGDRKSDNNIKRILEIYYMWL